MIHKQSTYQITALNHSPKLSPNIQVLLKWSKNKVLILLKAEAITMPKHKKLKNIKKHPGTILII